MKAWVTRYALTSGISEVEGELYDKIPSMLVVKGKTAFSDQCFHGKGTDWHESREQAVLRANSMKKKKIASLQKQIKMLESLEFN